MKEILLSQNRVALVDDEDYEYINKYKWTAHKYKGNNYYATRHSSSDHSKTEMMHRIIMRVSGGIEIDHKNHNGLDNRRQNLRLCNRSQNSCNQRIQKIPKTSVYKGVYWNKDKQKWVAQIQIANRKRIYLGSFDIEFHAALAYDKAIKKYYGEFALPNFKEV